MPSDDGLNLVPYRGPLLTIGGELDKPASKNALERGADGIVPGSWLKKSAED